MPLTTQVKVLRVLEQREVVRVGSSAVVPVDIRVLAATNQNLVELVANRRFREDLYFRLKVVAVDIPPLRARPEDVPVMAEAFLKELADRHGTGPRTLAPEVLRALQQYAWPGNVRELRNVIETLVVTAGHELIVPADLPPSIQPAAASAVSAPIGWTGLVGHTAEEVEREHIRATLAAVEGNRAKASRMLGIGERTLYRKIKQYAL
jgi:two-component system, NtrC family, response regulator HydG